jgi:hypothetical protein
MPVVVSSVGWHSFRGHTMTLEANVTEAISLAADLSRTGQWNSYLSHIKVAYGIAGEQIWEAL